MNRGFASDNGSGIHPRVLKKITEVNAGHVYGYGNDPYTAAAIEAFKQHFGEDSEIFLVFNGTAANVLSVSQLLKSTQAIIATHIAHIYSHECGGTEHFCGCKIIPVQADDGKLTPTLIESVMIGIGDDHYTQPKLISITQLTEIGTLYSIEEIRAITRYAKAKNLWVHMDGARLANAACSLNVPLSALTKDIGIDVLSFGGTKNGLMAADAIIFFNKELSHDFRYLRKQAMQTASKMRFLSAQFLAYFEDDLWRENAAHANQMAMLLYTQLNTIPEIQVKNAPAGNLVFVHLPQSIIPPLLEKFSFYVRNADTGLIRLVCSFDTTVADIQQFTKLIRDLL